MLAASYRANPIFPPTWHCFCCEDTGYVRDVLIKLVIPDYDTDKDRNVACQNCQRVSIYAQAIIDSLDWRFTPDLCSELDRLEREDWARTVEKQSQLRERALGLVDELQKGKALAYVGALPKRKWR